MPSDLYTQTQPSSVMDIDGPTGGYNLTMAFATARMAVASVGATAS